MNRCMFDGWPMLRLFGWYRCVRCRWVFSASKRGRWFNNRPEDDNHNGEQRAASSNLGSASDGEVPSNPPMIHPPQNTCLTKRPQAECDA